MGALVSTIVAVAVLCLIVAVIVSWVIISHEPFTLIELKNGSRYSIAGREYVFPNITIEGKCLLLKESVIENLRTIVGKTHELLRTVGVEYHCSGGTLLGIVRHGAIPMPNDDDIDVAVDYHHKDFLFSDAFRQKALEFGLDVIFLAGTTTTRADRHGAAVRLQLLNSNNLETCDIFFLVKEDKLVYKVDGWLNNKTIKNAKEQFAINDVYPRQLIHMDGMNVYLPNNPEAMLKQQYGADVLKTAKIRPRLISHIFPMKFLRLLWVNKV